MAIIDNSQNTVAGTQNGGSVLSSVGNSVLEAIDKISNVAVGITNTVGGAAFSTLDVYGSFRDRLKTLGLIKDDDNSQVQQAVASTNATTAQAFFSDPARIQKALVYATVISGAGVLIYYLIKKK